MVDQNSTISYVLGHLNTQLTTRYVYMNVALPETLQT